MLGEKNILLLLCSYTIFNFEKKNSIYKYLARPLRIISSVLHKAKFESEHTFIIYEGGSFWVFRLLH